MQKVRFILDVKNSNVDVICATSGNDCPLNRDPTDEYNAYVDMTVMLLSWTSRLHMICSQFRFFAYSTHTHLRTNTILSYNNSYFDH